MNLEKLKERLQEIEVAMLQARANFNALEGAKQELLHWVGKLEEDNNKNL
jgi:hypothetical protein